MKDAAGRFEGDGAAVRRRNATASAAQLNEIRLSRPKTTDAWTSPPVSRVTRQARLLAKTLGAVGLPAAILSAAGRVLAANKLFNALKPDMISGRDGPPRFADKIADRQVGDALARIGGEPGGGIPQVIPVRGNNGKPAAIAHLIAVRDDEKEAFAGIYGILVVVPLLPRPALNPLTLQKLFGLSPAESRVACGIAGRKTIEAIADDFSISRETVRSQLKIVLAKTGTKRQLDLAVLLHGLQLPRI